MSSSTVSFAGNAVQSTCQDLSLLKAKVFTNRVILSEILSNLTNMKDRVAAEKTCRLMKEISKIALWNFKGDGDKLSIGYFSNSTNALLQLGDVKFIRPSLTLVGRRDASEEGRYISSQPESLLTALNGLADRFGRNIRRLSVGGYADLRALNGSGCHQLILTADLLDVLSTGFPNLQEVAFQECTFDKEAANYTREQSETLFPKLRSLNLSAVSCDSDAPAEMIMHIVKPRLQKLVVKHIRVEDMGDGLLERLSEGHCSIGNIDVTIANYFRAQETDQRRFLRVLSRHCQQMTVHLDGEHSKPAPTIARTLLAAVELPNLVELYVNHTTANHHEDEDFKEAMKNLRERTNLKELALNGCINPNTIVETRNTLAQLTNLKKLKISHVSRFTQNTDLEEMMSMLPTELENLELLNFEIGEKQLKMAASRTQNLRHLKLLNLQGVSGNSVEQCLPYWVNLETFSCDSTLNSQSLSVLACEEMMPKLQNVNICTLAKEVSIGTFTKLTHGFQNVVCTTSASEDLCRLRISNRRNRTTELFSEENIHCDHPFSFHEKSSKLDWFDMSL